MRKESRVAVCVSAAAALLLIVCRLLIPSAQHSILTAPFVLSAMGLRALSLSGTWGNLAAILLFAVTGLLPLLPVLRRKWCKEDVLLPLCSLSLWYALYHLINPALLPVVLSGSTGQMILCGCVYSTILCWGILRLMRWCGKAGSDSIYQALRIFLYILMAEFAFSIFTAFTSLWESIGAVKESNTMPGLDLAPTYLFLGLSTAATVTEYALDAFVMVRAVRLLWQLEQDPYSEACCLASQRTTAACRVALVTIALSSTALTVLQVLFASRLHSLAATFRVPVTSMALVFALMALNRLLSEGRLLKEDNELFI